MISSYHPPLPKREVRVCWRSTAELTQLTRAECQRGLVLAESLQVLHTDFPSSLRRESAPQQRPHTQVVIVFNPVLFGCESIHSTSPYSCDGVFFFVLVFLFFFFVLLFSCFWTFWLKTFSSHLQDVSHFRVLVVSGFLDAYLFEYDDFTVHGNHNPHNARAGALLIHRPV